MSASSPVAAIRTSAGRRRWQNKLPTLFLVGGLLCMNERATTAVVPIWAWVTFIRLNCMIILGMLNSPEDECPTLVSFKSAIMMLADETPTHPWVQEPVP